MLPVSWVNDPRVIARDDCFVSINATTEVDLVGQCASETVGGRYWSSSGGQADFARGAMYSEKGSARSEERRVGKECVSTCRSRWSPDHKKKQHDRYTDNGDNNETYEL